MVQICHTQWWNAQKNAVPCPCLAYAGAKALLMIVKRSDLDPGSLNLGMTVAINENTRSQQELLYLHVQSW